MVKFTEKQRQWMAFLLITLITATTSLLLGVNYPIPPPPVFTQVDDEIIALGTTHFTNIEAEDVTATDDLAVTDDAAVGGDITITGGTTASSDITFANGTTLGETVDTVLDFSEFLAATEQPVFALSAAGYITPTGTYQPITSTAAISANVTTAIMSGTVAGQLLVIFNENASDAIVIPDGANTVLGGDKTLTGGQGDNIFLWWDGVDWICIGYNDN